MSPTTKRKSKAKTTRKTAAKPRVPKKRAVSPEKPTVHPPSTGPKKVAPAPRPQKSYLLAVRLKGPFGTPWEVQRSLDTLRLKRKFNAVLLENTPSTVGMLRAVKDYVTWGEATVEDITALLRERAELPGASGLSDQISRERFGEASVHELASALTQGRISLATLWRNGITPVFRLHPPSGGFEKTAKRAYGSGGELGRRQTSLSGLLNRMI